MKRILIITSSNTGSGHKSISDSLTEQFARMPDVEVKAIDGFGLMGKPGLRSEGVYGFLTRHARAVYNLSWDLTMAHPPKFAMMARLCRRRFTEEIRVFRPDLILSVHSLFNHVLTRMLGSLGLDIPVVVLQADLINIHSTWCNPGAFRTICPTREAYDCSVSQGMTPDKLDILSFPTRGRFCDEAGRAGVREYDASRPLHCLMMSGGEGSGNIRAYAEAILESTDAELTIICGRNKKLYGKLQKELYGKYGGRVNVLGFVNDVEREMLRSDLMITRSSPNSMLEAVVMNVPLVITGSPLRQERDNPRIMQERGFGVVCSSPSEIHTVIDSLLDNGGARLGEISAAQRSGRSFDSARDIAVYVTRLCEPLAYTV